MILSTTARTAITPGVMVNRSRLSGLALAGPRITHVVVPGSRMTTATFSLSTHILAGFFIGRDRMRVQRLARRRRHVENRRDDRGWFWRVVGLRMHPGRDLVATASGHQRRAIWGHCGWWCRCRWWMLRLGTTFLGSLVFVFFARPVRCTTTFLLGIVVVVASTRRMRLLCRVTCSRAMASRFGSVSRHGRSFR